MHDVIHVMTTRFVDRRFVQVNMWPLSSSDSCLTEMATWKLQTYADDHINLHVPGPGSSERGIWHPVAGKHNLSG